MSKDREMEASAVSRLEQELREVKRKLNEAEETLETIRTGGIDALIIDGDNGLQIYTLRSADHAYRVLIEEMNEGALMLSTDGIIMYSNRFFSELLGMPLEQITGKNFFMLVDEVCQEDLKKFFSLASEAALKTESQLLNAAGESIPVRVCVKLLKEQDVPVLNVTIDDIRDQKESERQIELYQDRLERKVEELGISNTELEQFAYVASHDLSEPLRMVSSFTDLLFKKLDVTDGEALEYKTFINDGINRMQTMIKDLLEYSRVGRKDIIFSQVDCNELIEHVKTNLHDKIKETDASVTYGKLPAIWAVPGLIIQVFQNLVENAMKFSRPGVRPEVKIECSRNGNLWEFCVEDNGIGIDKKFANRIFIIFQRLHTRDTYPGTGIGLSITKKIVEFHGGTIWMSNNEESGCSFNFTIPVKRNEKPSAPADDGASA